MSLLGEIHGSAKALPGGLAEPLRRLCTALLAENHLPPAAVVAARIRLPASEGHQGDGGLDGSTEMPTAIPRELGWSGIPIFWEAPAGCTELEVIAHVRLKRRRRLKTVALGAP